jgi:serine/threonine protein kinase
MTSLIAGIEPGFEPIAGYVLREKIGSGGFGEVWLADAPGGLQKAVKFVYGSIDDRAGTELRALQRIRMVHHPFILSLERIEVVNQQLIVVTELADGTILDRFREFRQRDMVGIPRNRLLDFMREAADALDFLCQKHDLQHLDIKPANLLLVADHVKVADFGLIKDIQNKNMSLMSGMTPTYAAPEMFDGRPGRNSDQYSLAVVYQEMLTGNLPFLGRTTAQLATEHLQKAPDLEALPLSERPIVAKALSKKPGQRFSCCREFIDALSKLPTEASQGHAVPASNAKAGKAKVRPTPRQAAYADYRKPMETEAMPVLARVSSETKPPLIRPAMQLPVSSPKGLSPCYFLGLGRTGAEALIDVRRRLRRQGIGVDEGSDRLWSIIDVDERSLRRAMDNEHEGHLSEDNILHLPLESASSYRTLGQDRFAALSRRWLYNIPRSGLTEGVRPMAMLALLGNSGTAYDHLRSHLEQWFSSPSLSSDRPARIYLIGSAHGATSSVLTIELAFMLRQLLADFQFPASVQAVLSVASQSDGASTELATVVGMTCLREIDHYFKTNGLYPGLPEVPEDHTAMAPWKNVYFIPGGTLGSIADWHEGIRQMSDFLCLDACTSFGPAMDHPRHQSFVDADQDSKVEWQPWVRIFSSKPIDLKDQCTPEILTKRVLFHLLQEWRVALMASISEDATDERLGRMPSTATTVTSSASKIELLVSDLFRQQHWTAQSWVRQCMEYLVPLSAAEQPVHPDSHLSPPPSEIDETTDPLLSDAGLERVCQALQVSITDSQKSARKLLDQSIHALIDWLTRFGFHGLSNLTQMPDLLKAVDRRFLAQGESLRNVGERMYEQRDELTQQLNASTKDMTLDRQQELAHEEALRHLRSLDFQASMHLAASRMLLRLREHVARAFTVWKSQARNISIVLDDWQKSLDNELKIQGNTDKADSGQTLNLPPGWQPVRDDAYKSLARALHGHIFPSLGAALAGKAHAMVIPTESGTVVSILTPSINHRQFDFRAMQPILEAGETTARDKAMALKLISGSQDSKAQLSTTQSALDEKTLTSLFPSVDQPLFQIGLATHRMLLLPRNEIDSESIQQLQQKFQPHFSFAEIDGLNSSVLCEEAEHIDLMRLADFLWTPSLERGQLLNKLHSRIDIDWIDPAS